MSAPQTNIERQKRRHRGPIAGITLGVVFVLLLVLGYGWTVGEDPDAPPVGAPLPAAEPMADPTAPPATGAEAPAAPTD